ncbi:hypothetical protein [Halioxenophilus aromaticivorans]|uniref:DUF2889 domain-containing protein n=1 Tax=Halioxenophilus aromaticivorans TaxID=1306992 RepID=A0AAV3U6K7_9ALTE
MPSFRRVIEIRTLGNQQQGSIKAALEDDYHHFRVELRVTDGTIKFAKGTALRTPYTLCKNSVEALPSLEGKSAVSTSQAINQITDAKLQCTHQLDLAGLGLAALAKHIARRRYDIEVPRHVNGQTTPSLSRDGDPYLCWTVDNDEIKSPDLFAGVSIGRGMASWASSHLDPEMTEATLVLRRCTMISVGRLRNLDLERHAHPWGRCYVQQPERAIYATRIIGSTQDFTNRLNTLCSQDQNWLRL